MKVTVILLNHNRSNLTSKVIRQNFFNSGYNADVYLIDNGSHEREYHAVLSMFRFTRDFHVEQNLGVSGGLNLGIQFAIQDGSDAVVMMANDILMPDNWLKSMVEHAEAIPNTGTVGIHCVEHIGGLTYINGKKVHLWDVAFGNVLIPMTTIEQIGFYNTDLDPYSVNDADFAYRAKSKGLIHYYIPEMKSTHIGHDVGTGSEYREMKDRSLQIGGQKALQWKQWYKENGVYLPYDQEEAIINKNQYFGES